MTNYENWMGEDCEPADRQVYGRFHKILEETVYPINAELVSWNCYNVAQRLYQTQSLNNGNYFLESYHWWIHFDDFNPFSTMDMGF